MTIKLLGTGFSKCKTLEKKLLELKDSLQLGFTFEKVSELDDIMRYGVMMTPALVAIVDLQIARQRFPIL